MHVFALGAARLRLPFRGRVVLLWEGERGGGCGRRLYRIISPNWVWEREPW